MTKSPAARQLAKKAAKKTSRRSPKKASKKAAKKAYKKAAKKTYDRPAKETDEITPFYESSRLMAIAINASQNLIWRAQSQPNGPWVTDWAPMNKTIQYDAMVAGMSREGRVIVVGHQRPTAAVHFYIQINSSTIPGKARSTWRCRPACRDSASSPRRAAWTA